MEIAFQQKLGSGFFGGEGLFLTILTGPGKIWLQTMPIQNMAGEVRPYLNINNK
ncbi:MAG: AIM24 family protein [Bacillota bacterium]